MKQKVVTYRLPEALRDELRKRAQECGMTMIGYIRYLLLTTKDK